jgi:hypothetical protein
MDMDMDIGHQTLDMDIRHRTWTSKIKDTKPEVQNERSTRI